MNEVFGLNREAWDRWVQYRRSRRKGYKTEFGMEKAQKKLASFGEYQMEAVERCMEKEWIDLYPLPKEMIAQLEKRKREDAKHNRHMEELTRRAALVGFRKPFPNEDEIGYRTLVERAEHAKAMNRPKGPALVSDLLKRFA